MRFVYLTHASDYFKESMISQSKFLKDIGSVFHVWIWVVNNCDMRVGTNFIDRLDRMFVYVEVTDEQYAMYQLSYASEAIFESADISQSPAFNPHHIHGNDSWVKITDVFLELLQ